MALKRTKAPIVSLTSVFQPAVVQLPPQRHAEIKDGGEVRAGLAKLVHGVGQSV